METEIQYDLALRASYARNRRPINRFGAYVLVEIVAGFQEGSTFAVEAADAPRPLCMFDDRGHATEWAKKMSLIGGE